MILSKRIELLYAEPIVKCIRLCVCFGVKGFGSLRQRLLLALICCWLLLVTAKIQAFMVPQAATVGPGSYWVYQSNFGQVRADILTREQIPEGWLYRWRLSVLGLNYEEQLRLTATQLGVTHREFAAWFVYHADFSFPQDELTLPVPLSVHSTWDWHGPVLYRKQTGTTQVKGQVVAQSEVTVPAGTFPVFEIVLERNDSFGTQQNIRLWLNEEIGVVKAEGELRWTGLVGTLQDLVGLRYLAVELLHYSIAAPEQ